MWFLDLNEFKLLFCFSAAFSSLLHWQLAVGSWYIVKWPLLRKEQRMKTNREFDRIEREEEEKKREQNIQIHIVARAHLYSTKRLCMFDDCFYLFIYFVHSFAFSHLLQRVLRDSYKHKLFYSAWKRRACKYKKNYNWEQTAAWSPAQYSDYYIYLYK